jgi:oxygen-independent coproporphyrinogen-3 oxidase
MVFSAFGHEPVEINSVYVGGGTPSIADPELLAHWIEQLNSFGRFRDDFEFTLEANPESVTERFTLTMADSGANRLVLGVQSFDTKMLARLNRRQRIKDIYRAFYLARLAGFDNIGADLIFGLPGQTLKQLRQDISRLVALRPQHVSFYALTVESGTLLAKQVESGKIELPDDDTLAQMYQIGSHLLMDAGFARYEVSNFARPGFRSKHNSAYWNFTPYIGLGPGAHGFVNGYRYANIADIDRYIDSVEKGQVPWSFCEKLTEEDLFSEIIMLSLRTAEGIDKRSMYHRFGHRGLAALEGEAAFNYIKAGLLAIDEGRLHVTDRGNLFVDSIVADLLS